MRGSGARVRGTGCGGSRGAAAPGGTAVAAEEATVGEGAAPGFANEGGADEVRGLVRREAEEDLLDGILHQRRRRARAAVRHVDRWLRSAGPPVGCEIGLVSGFGRLDSRGVGPATCGAKTTSRTETGNNFEEFSHKQFNFT